MAQGFHILICHVGIKYGGIGNDLAKIIRKFSIMGERIDKAIWSDLYQDLEL